MRSTKKVLVSGVAGLLLLGTVAGTVVAAPPTPGAPGPTGQQAGAGYGQGAGAGYGFRGMGGSESAAKLLGMTAEQIEAERLAGKTLGQIADAKGVSRDALLSAMLESRKAALDARVKAGTLTREQADAALAAMKTRMGESLDRVETGPNRPEDGQALGLAWGRTDRGQQLGPRDGTGAGPLGQGRGQGPRR